MSKVIDLPQSNLSGVFTNHSSLVRDSLSFAVILLLNVNVLWAGEGSGGAPRVVLTISDSRFLTNGEPTFLLGFSYFAALGAPEEFISRDLDDFQHSGFNWLRVWATWSNAATNISAVDFQGAAREPFLSKLNWLVAECDRRGLIVDITLNRHNRKVADSLSSPDGALPNMEAHQAAVETLVTALASHRNWYLDLANEHDVRDDRYVSDEQLKTLRELVRRLDAQRLVTASFGGHELSTAEIREAVQTLGFDLLCPHRPRDPQSPSQTEARTREYLAAMKEAGRVVPLLYQEPFRRDYGTWQPTANDFLTDLRGAKAGAAAGWCFHNGGPKRSTGGERQRSFDLRNKRLFDQLDSQEHSVVENAAKQSSSLPPAAR